MDRPCSTICDMFGWSGCDMDRPCSTIYDMFGWGGCGMDRPCSTIYDMEMLVVPKILLRCGEGEMSS